MIKLLTTLVLFLKNPTEFPTQKPQLKTKIKWISLLILFDFLLMFIFIPLQKIPQRLGFIDPESHRIVELFSEKGNSIPVILSTILLIPFLEELISRLPLQIKPINFLPFIIAIPLYQGIFYTYKIHGEASWVMLFPICIAGIVSFLIFNKFIFSKIKTYLQSKYKLYFYFIATVFALLHLSNFQFSWYLLIFAPLLVLPQFSVGLILGFVRNHCGFFYGFYFHGIHNAALLLLFNFMMSSSTTTAVISKTNTDGYQILLVEEDFSEKLTDLKITPNEIKIQGTMSEVISKLTRRKHKRFCLKTTNLPANK
ncbi:hypothetical protein [Maribellus maritimus]|uniref:hypothetical protein n=1 Tax=Maribellus maritimus TaxID=2870838 RepID=UPI001EEC9ACD|nr:hypothetical protein [Maribellus maritimus]MCG6189764.1 hypothetical protein [Maribellus maritimus]